MKRWLISIMILMCSLGSYGQFTVCNGQTEFPVPTDDTDILYLESLTDNESIAGESPCISETREENDITTASMETTDIMTFDYKQSKYWRRYIDLRTAGWITFGVGAGFFIGGYAAVLGAWVSPSEKIGNFLATPGIIMLISSPFLVVTSIPLLACAYWNRYKAKKMTIDVGMNLINSGGRSSFKMTTPALALTMNF
ncbi:MAG: hypothetical protein K2L45_00125 [Muribaculaceae bacterium]|nr:hypothetical protein [Muribaculaceae bacterium]